LFRDIHDREGETWALNGLGEATHAADSPADALAHHTSALTIATDPGIRAQQTRAHAGLGHAYRALSGPDPCPCTLEQAVAIYTDLGSPEANQVRLSNRQFGQNLASLMMSVEPPDRSDGGQPSLCTCGCGAAVAAPRKFVNQRHYGVWLSQVRYFGRNRKSEPR
jgi:hypothetical protein